MADWPLAAVRFGLYSGLGVLFEAPVFVLTTQGGEALWRLLRLRRMIVVLAATSLALSMLGFSLLAARMSGAPVSDLDLALVNTLLLETALGWALIARIGAIVFFLAAALLMPVSRAQQSSLAICSAIALATLAWAGHGASGEGVSGAVHLAADIVHLLAASTWFGALVLLLILVRPGVQMTRERAVTAHLALAGFGRTGTLAVALVVLTGVANWVFTTDGAMLTTLGESAYGRLLLAKLALFAAMLVCAALNRYRLTPSLEASIARGETRASLKALRRSIAVETALAFAILALVSWLGMLDPGTTI